MTQQETLRHLLAHYLKEPENLALAFDEPDRDLFALGLDSMSAFALIDDLQDQGVSLDYVSFLAHSTVNGLRELMR
ncbi:MULTISPECIES: acyl carrier protein [Rothia]|uniref:Carrier domain-containing protein n=1 Tax=Rothia nasimurium TaxID=85336 RepID=A0A1Y1RMY1_9MICC|nr:MULTISPECIES: acyl carrier protein [Rothia]ORC15969.1 hypothetical protein A7979_04955 [Rothia nasimurium]